jgi:hypothetical protein
MMHGYYSEKQRLKAGSLVYLDADGEEVVVTDVYSVKKDKSPLDDMVYVGIVTTFVRSIPADSYIRIPIHTTDLTFEAKTLLPYKRSKIGDNND